MRSPHFKIRNRVWCFTLPEGGGRYAPTAVECQEAPNRAILDQRYTKNMPARSLRDLRCASRSCCCIVWNIKTRRSWRIPRVDFSGDGSQWSIWTSCVDGKRQMRTGECQCCRYLGVNVVNEKSCQCQAGAKGGVSDRTSKQARSGNGSISYQ